MNFKNFPIKKQKLKIPILNDHKSQGLYDFKWFPPHYAWISHLILGLLSIKYPVLVPIFICYQISQMVIKRELWNDFIDIVEFYIGKKLLIIILLYLFYNFK